MKKITLSVFLLLISSMALIACGGGETTPVETPTEEPAVVVEEAPTEEPAEEEMAATVVDVAVENGNFNTLVAAVTAAGLAETLGGDGPFTIFAPTDDAFAALPEGTVESLLEDPEGALTDILLYHVVEGAVVAETVVTLDSATTLSGKDISIALDGDTVVLNDTARVTAVNIEGSNGVIHVIDTVLMPPSDEMSEEEMMEDLPTIAEIATDAGTFNTLVAALDAAGLVETFSSEGEYTVFAPTDDAFAALPEGTVESLLEDPEGMLTEILLYHVVAGTVKAETVVTLDSATTLLGKDVAITVEGDSVYLNDTVQVITTDIEASNGVIHVIDAVLLPPSDEMTEEDMMEELPTIAEIAVDAEFNTLVTALDAASLIETFSSEGDYTVFAPTDDAFAALPEGTLEALLEDPEGALTDILLYHVVEGSVYAETVVTLDSATTLLDKDITITVDGGDVYLNDNVAVLVTDIEASNGVVHVIDAVLLPPADEMATIAEIAVEAGTFDTLVAALDAANLVETFSSEGDYTVFAPTDDAFAALPEGTLEALLEDPEGALTDILLYHVVEGTVLAETVVTLDAATTLLGEDVTITIEDGVVYLNDDVAVIATDIEASNGVIHVIDGVLIP